METLYVYSDSDGPILSDGYYLTGYHNNPIKVGERVILLFNIDNDHFPHKQSSTTIGIKDFRRETVKVMSIRFQYWNFVDGTNPDKYILEETVPSYKNWLKVQFITEERDEKLNELIDGKL